MEENEKVDLDSYSVYTNENSDDNLVIDMGNKPFQKGDRVVISMNTLLDKDGNIIGYIPEYGVVE